MADFIFVSLLVAFTALCVAYISWCDRIIGSDEPGNGASSVTDTQKEAVKL